MNHILSKTQYLALKSFIKQQSDDRTLTSSNIIIYNIVRGKPAKNGFTPLTNAGRLNGVQRGEWDAFIQAKNTAIYNLQRSNTALMFGEALTPSEIESLITAIKAQS